MKTRMRGVWTVFRKEVLDAARDRRSIGSLVFAAMIAPLLFGVMFTVAAERRRSADEVRLPVQGAEFAPAFVDWLRQQTGVTVVPPPADAEAAVRSRSEDVVLIIEKDFSKNMARAVPAPVKLVSDATRDSARPKVARVRSLVNTYSSQTSALRLVARGVAPSVATAVRVEEVEVSSSQQRLAIQLSILPLLLVIAALTGGMQVAIDSTAGERERGSLEPLLLNPRVARRAGDGEVAGGIAVRLRRGAVFDGADGERHAAGSMARPRDPLPRQRCGAHEPAGAHPAACAAPERGGDVRSPPSHAPSRKRRPISGC